MWKHTPQPSLSKKAQDQEYDNGPTDILMEIVSRITNMTAHYSRRKLLAEIQDANTLREDIKLATQELETKPL